MWSRARSTAALPIERLVAGSTWRLRVVVSLRSSGVEVKNQLGHRSITLTSNTHQQVLEVAGVMGATLGGVARRQTWIDGYDR